MKYINFYNLEKIKITHSAWNSPPYTIEVIGYRSEDSYDNPYTIKIHCYDCLFDEAAGEFARQYQERIDYANRDKNYFLEIISRQFK